jgi:hypothetical protein
VLPKNMSIYAGRGRVLGDHEGRPYAAVQKRRRHGGRDWVWGDRAGFGRTRRFAPTGRAGEEALCGRAGALRRTGTVACARSAT